MEQDREPRDDAREPSSDDQTGAANVPPRERHDVVETEGSASFWNDVDGMLTGEFAEELLPKDGDYRLGAMPDAFPSSPRDEGVLEADPADPAEFDITDATGPIMNPPTSSPASSHRGAHDGDPNLLGFDAAPTVSTDSISGAAPATPATPAAPVAHVPLFDPATEVALSKQAGGSSPVSLERSTVVDPVHGPPPGTTFLEGDQSAAERRAGLSVARPTVSLESTGQAAPTIPGAYVASAPPPVYDSRSILLDVVDRQWLTSGLIVLATLSVGVIAWVLLFTGDDGGGELIAASTTPPDPTGPTASEDAAAASAGAGTGAFEDPTTASTTVSTTAATEPVTSRPAPSPARPRPTNRPSPGPAPTQSATTPTTSSTDGSPTSDTSDSSSSDPSSTDTTTDTTTDPTGSTDTTIDGTVTTAGTTETTGTTSSSTPSSETTPSSTPTTPPDDGGTNPPSSP
ncbi:MAG: hypothetical protein ACR2QO_18785 [Acidimicrobiales bacterium]